jgi:KaiC/GvpD/RAD55 family RecA-like ATPase
MVNRIKTYIKGLDAQLNGGIPEGHVVLLCGQPGTMKSSVAYSMMFSNALNEKIPSVYVSLEQSSKSLRDNMVGLGLKHEEVATLVGIQDLAMIRKKLTQLDKSTWYEVFKLTFKNFQDQWGSKIFVLDSLPIFELMAKFKEPREELFHFFEWLRDLNLTSILITEMSQESNLFSTHGEDFLADGIMHLDLKREINAVNLYLGIVKMRKTQHKRSYFPLLFENGAFEIVVD